MPVALGNSNLTFPVGN